METVFTVRLYRHSTLSVYAVALYRQSIPSLSLYTATRYRHPTAEEVTFYWKLFRV